MNLNQLKYFLVLSQIQHYRKASEILHITQPSLSNAISSLEEELEIRLFEKKGRNIVLSKYGKEFFPYVEKMFKELNFGIKRIKDLQDSNNEVIKIAFIYTLSSDLIPTIISEFFKTRKSNNINFQIFEGDTTTKECTPDIIKGLKKNDFDVVFVNRINKNDSDIKFTKVCDQEYVVITDNNSPLARYSEIDLRDTEGIPLIQYTKKLGLKEEIFYLFNQVNIKPDVYTEVEDEISLIGLVRSGIGFAVTPIKKSYLNMDVKVLPVTTPYFKRGIYMGYLKNRCKSEILEEFIDFIENKFEFQYKVG